MKFLRDKRESLRNLLKRSTWTASTESIPPYLWSKGISLYCDVRGPDFYWRENTETCQPESFFRQYYANAGGLVWVRLSTQSRNGMTCDLDNFVRGALPAIKKPFALITTDGDVSVPSGIPQSTVDALLGCPWLKSWHTQNYDGHPNEKLAPLPIGMDFHTPRPFSSPRRLAAQLDRIREQRPTLDQAPLRVFCDLELNLCSQERHQAVAALRGCSHVDFQKKRLSQNAIWRRYAQYPFVVSTTGNGLDSHRTWELLYLGSIVITKTSSLDGLFKDLPVVIVNDWGEARDERNLEKWLRQYGRLTDSGRIKKQLDPANLIKSVRETLAC
jgi:hypothetical protein